MSDELNYEPTVGDLARRVRYVTFPTNYTDENSSLEELLWQQVLEQRAIRASIWWSIAVTVLMTIAVVTALWLR